ncbi:tryptophan transporter [Synergistes jonesii]|uniref:tryptophan transporter n=1 Tax=Synergistes jonesii TaxID=2754 RepID=UPI00248E3D3C|nr:tryptophan transporter [Synergistes jonesii]
MAAEKKAAGLSVSQIMLVALLLASGAVMKFFIGSIFSAGMKPNFIIAMYCLAILLVKPKLKDAFIIGLLAGAVCQFFPGTPYINFPSEAAGAAVMALFVMAGRRAGGALMPALSTFVSTVVSGGVFMILLYALFFSGGSRVPAPLALFLGIIFGTAAVNALIVQLLYLPVAAAMRIRADVKKER